MIITNDEELTPYLHNRKASEVFLEYAEPYLQILLEEIDDIPSNKKLEKILIIFKFLQQFLEAVK